MSSAMVAAFNAPRAAPSVTSRRRAAASRSRGTFSVSAARRAPAVAFVDVVDEKEPGILLKPFEESMQKSLLFGVSHMTNNHEAAEYILRTRPRSVVVETGLCKAHNAARGTCFNFDELFASIHIGGNTDAEEALQFITRVAHQLRLEEKPLEGSPFWAHMKTQLPAEALVYAAAFAVDARLVFGDRPKEATYRRLSVPTRGTGRHLRRQSEKLPSVAPGVTHDDPRLRRTTSSRTCASTSATHPRAHHLRGSDDGGCPWGGGGGRRVGPSRGC